jgi:hypothetical protein
MGAHLFKRWPPFSITGPALTNVTAMRASTTEQVVLTIAMLR